MKSIILCLALLPPLAQSPELHLTILHTSDEHSALVPGPFVDYRADDPGATRGGMARLATVLAAVRARKAAAGEPVLLTSAGDHLTGSPFSWLALAGEAPELALMIELGYDAITFGNHEFDYGSERLAGYLAAAGYPGAAGRTAIVATNTRPPAGHPLDARGVRRTHLITLPNGLRVGIIGLLGEGAARFAPAASPVTFVDAASAAAAAEAELRAAGAHIVVAITHAGLAEDRALARVVPGIDVILGGHDHRLLDEPEREGRTLIVHPGAHLRQLVQLELGYDAATGSVRVRNRATGAPFVIVLDASVPESEWLRERVVAYRARLEQWIATLTGGRITDLGQRVATSDFTLAASYELTENALGNLVADAMRVVAGEASGRRVDFAFQASGQIRGSIVPGSRPWNRGDIAFFDLVNAVGLGTGPDSAPGYPVVGVWLTGDEVRRALEVSILLSRLMGSSYYLQVSGLRVRYDPRRAILARVPVRGTPIPTGRAVLAAERSAADASHPLERGDTALYYVVTDRYVASFLPMVGRFVPRLAIVPKDATGAPLADLDDAIVRRAGEELKVWQAVLEYVTAPADAGHAPHLSRIYASPGGRLVQAQAPPLWLWALAAAAPFVVLAGALVTRRARIRRKSTVAGRVR
jgi:5'-nucleotidase / UDP-sugar diphosphatase